MRIGLDFDNTIVCYDEAFYQLARESASIPENLPHTKESVKAHLQSEGKNDFWTSLQGIAYGPRMESASPFPGVDLFLRDAKKAGTELFIVSHRSPKPYSGLDFDLHGAARSWLQNRSWVASGYLNSDHIFFESTKKDKLRKISELQLDCFVDDLMEIFNDPDFPAQTRKIHFFPGAQTMSEGVVRNWEELLSVFRKLWNS